MTPHSNLPGDVVSAAPLCHPKPLRQIHELPGPAGVPVFGNLLQIKLNRIHRDIEQWCGKYGKLFRVAFGPFKILVVADPALIAVILRERPARFRRPSRSAEIALEMSGNLGLFMAEAEDWRNQRRMVMQALAPAVVKAYFPSLQKVATRLQRRWEIAARDGATIDLASDLKRYTVDIIAGLAFGTDVNTIESGEDVIQQHLDVILPAVARRSMSLFAYWRYVRLPADRRLDRSVAALRQAVNGFIANARGDLAADLTRRTHPRNLLEAMIVAADEDASGLDDRAVSGNVSTMLLAGEDTTANTLAWMLYLLARNPQAMQLAQAEVRRVAPDSHAFTAPQMDALTYIDACTQEALRLKPVAPFIPVEAVADTVVADVAVPSGTRIWCVLRHDSVDDRFFEQAERFDPDRWLEHNGEPAPASADKRICIPFGAGPRTCPGRYLALLEIKVAMAMLLANFDVIAVETSDGNEAREVMGFVMSPASLKMRLRPLAQG